MQVLDYSSGAPAAADVAAAGYGGAIRYLSWLPNPKCLTAGEAQDYWLHGLLLACVWEVGESPLGTDPVAAGREAARQADLDGFRGDSVIYVAADYDAPTSDWAAFAGWGDDFARASGHPWRGYCKGALGEQLVSDGHFPSFWDPYAWSGNGQPTPHACLFQRLGGVVVGGVDCDVNDVRMADWGGWAPAHSPPPPVAPPPPLPPPQTYEKDFMTRTPLTIATDANGNGWATCSAVPFTKAAAVFANGSDPVSNHAYSPIPRLSLSDDGGATKVELEAGPPNGNVLVFVSAGA